MKIPFTKIALAATFGLAITFTFLSCSSDDDGGNKEQSYDYCITADNTCLVGPFTASTCKGQLSNSCPEEGSSPSVGSSSSKGSSSSVASPSSSSAGNKSSSSSNKASSSSVAGNVSSSSELVLSGWEESGTLELGGRTNETLGSFLDIDFWKVYKKSEAANNKNKIDLIFDGSSFLMPEGCVETNNSLCSLTMAGNDNYATIIKVPSSITANSTSDDVLSWIDDNIDNIDDYYVLTLAAKANDRFLVITDEDNIAFVVVGDVSTDSVKLTIGIIPIPE